MTHRFSVSTFFVTVLGVPCLLLAQQSGAPASPMGGLGGMLPMMLIMFAAVYFLMIRPEQKKQKLRQAMMQNIKKGDRVLTSSGILGTVGQVKESTMMIKIAENTIVEFAKSAVTSVVNKDGTEKPAEIAAEGAK